MAPIQVIPDPALPGHPFLERAHTAGVEHRLGQMDINSGMGPNHQTPAPAYGMPQQRQAAATAHYPGASQHTGYAQHQGVPLESPKYHSFILERVKMKSLDKTTAWTVAERKIHPMTPEKMKDRIAEYEKAPKSKKKSKPKVSGSILVALDSPDMNPSRQEHIKQLAQDLAYHEHGPNYVWKPVYIKLSPEASTKISKWKSLIVIMKGERRQGQVLPHSILKYPLEARIDISDDKRKKVRERLDQGLLVDYEYPWPKQAARPAPPTQNFQHQGWPALERHPPQPHWPAPNPLHGQSGWASQGHGQQHPGGAPQDRGQQRPDWPAHEHDHRKSTWKAQETVPAQPSQAKVENHRPVPIQFRESRDSSAEEGHHKAQNPKPVPIVQSSDPRKSPAEGGHFKAQSHRPPPIIEISATRPSSDDHQRRRAQVPASPSASDSSYKTRSSHSTARTQTPETIYTVSDTGATTSGSRRSGKADRRPSSSHHRPTGPSNESSHKYQSNFTKPEPSYREHRRRDPQNWGSSSKVETDDKTRRNPFYSRHEDDADEFIVVQPASGRNNRRRGNRRKSHGGVYREHTRYYNTEKSSSHHQSAERPRQSGRRDRSPSVSSTSSDSYESRYKFEDVFDDDDADSMGSRAPYTREPRARITPRFSERRGSTYARRERNFKSERAVPIVTESRNKTRHEVRRDRETDW